jgi:hypothetical protein
VAGIPVRFRFHGELNPLLEPAAWSRQPREDDLVEVFRTRRPSNWQTIGLFWMGASAVWLRTCECSALLPWYHHPADDTMLAQVSSHDQPTAADPRCRIAKAE